MKRKNLKGTDAVTAVQVQVRNGYSTEHRLCTAVDGGLWTALRYEYFGSTSNSLAKESINVTDRE